MKANGKNWIMFQYETKDCWDIRSSINFKTMSSLKDMDRLITTLREGWFTGFISKPKIVTPKEYYEARQSSYWKGYEEKLDKLALDCTQEWLDEYNNLLNQ